MKFYKKTHFECRDEFLYIAVIILATKSSLIGF